MCEVIAILIWRKRRSKYQNVNDVVEGEEMYKNILDHVIENTLNNGYECGQIILKNSNNNFDIEIIGEDGIQN